MAIPNEAVSPPVVPPVPVRPPQVAELIDLGEQLEEILDLIRLAREKLITLQDGMKPSQNLGSTLSSVKALRTTLAGAYQDANDIRTLFWKTFDEFEQKEIEPPVQGRGNPHIK